MLCGCVGGLGSPGPDRSIVTSAVPATAVAFPQDEEAADAATVRDAVSSASLDDLAGRRIPWANVATGSRGEIGDVTEFRDSGILCRRFTTSRESYGGVALFRGEACLSPAGNWWIRTFENA